MVRQVTQAGALILIAALYAGNAAAHGRESLEEDSCVRRIGENMVHLSAYQPQFDTSAQYCTEIPKVGDTYLVVDLIDPANRHSATVTRGRQTYRSPAFTVPVPGTASTVTVWGFTGVLLDRVLTALGWAVPWDTGRDLPAPL